MYLPVEIVDRIITIMWPSIVVNLALDDFRNLVLVNHVFKSLMYKRRPELLRAQALLLHTTKGDTLLSFMPKDPFSNEYLDRQLFLANLGRAEFKEINSKLLAFFRKEDAWIQSQLVTEQYPLSLVNQDDGTFYLSSRVCRRNGEVILIGSVLELSLQVQKKHHLGLYNYGDDAGHLTLIAREEIDEDEEEDESGPPMIFLDNVDL